MLSVYQLTLPTPYKVGPVNIYVIKNRPITLVDAGADTPAAYNKLRDILPLLGVNMKDIERIVITHSHPDHSGLAGKIVAETGATVLAHRREIRKLTGIEDYYRERMPFVIEAGISKDALQFMLGERDKLPRPVVFEGVIREVGDGDRLEFDAGTLQIMHLPGHSPGHICLYEPEQEFFFSGDFMLPHITPNPLMEPDPERPGRRLPTLSQYLHGLERVENMNISVVFPGHGGVFTDYLGVIKNAREHHQKQVSLILDKLKNREFNTFHLSREIYPHLGGWDIFLGISEIQAHLDLMADNHQIDCCTRDGVVYYSAEFSNSSLNNHTL